MGQIVKRKKKGRPSKADLARRASLLTPEATPPAEESDRRRSLRRRNVRYNNFIDYDDYLDEFEDFFEEEGAEPLDDEEEEEEARRKEKKLELVLNLHAQKQGKVGTRKKRRKRAGAARVFPARLSEPRLAVSDEDDYEEDEEDDMEGKTSQKKRVNGSDDDHDVNDDDDEEYGRNNGNEEDDDVERRERKCDHVHDEDSVPGTPSDQKKQFPLPERRTLELILDKLQKKDIYGVYAEPVDLEELPDYLDVIDHPMDFATVRKKLANGSYAFMEQFESDVFLICSNAMQYNSSDTVYYKQARTIQELAKKKFQKLRAKTERSEKDVKAEQKTSSSFMVRKQGKKPLIRPIQDPVGSDFSSGATLATRAEHQNGSFTAHGGGFERATIMESHLENNPSMVENLYERAEDLSSGKGNLPRYGRKPAVLEDRRATYNSQSHTTFNSESVLTTFDGEVKQLVAVGLHADFSYGRSLARFAATLGPIAWKIAAQKIELSLPHGCKYGRGWVGDYEPLPTPVLMLDTRKQAEPMFFPNLPFPPENHDAKPPLSSPNLHHPLPSRTASSQKPSSAKPSAFLSPSNQQNPPGRSFLDSHKKSSKLVELNLPPPCSLSDADNSIDKQASSMFHGDSVKARESKKLEVGAQSNGKAASLNGKLGSSSDAGGSFFPRSSSYGLTDPVEAMRISTQKAQHQVKPSQAETDTGNAAATAARAWMSIGSGNQNESPKGQLSVESLYNPTRQVQQIPKPKGQFPFPGTTPFSYEKSNSVPFQAFMPPPLHGGEGGGHMQHLPVMFPQFSRGYSQTPAKQWPDTCPPDLNIGFQPPGSPPVRQSGSAVTDSQQPDLALQL